jgi:hypothetical protein
MKAAQAEADDPKNKKDEKPKLIESVQVAETLEIEYITKPFIS